MKKETVIDIIKGVVGLAVGLGVSGIAANLISATTPRSIGKIAKILIYIGGAALTGFIGEEANKYAEHTIDSVVEAFDIAKEMVTKKEETTEEES